MANWNWLRPGMHIKRWVFLITFGLIILFIGAMFLTLAVFMPDAQPFGMDAYGTGFVFVVPGMVAVFIGTGSRKCSGGRTTTATWAT